MGGSNGRGRAHFTGVEENVSAPPTMFDGGSAGGGNGTGGDPSEQVLPSVERRQPSIQDDRVDVPDGGTWDTVRRSILGVREPYGLADDPLCTTHRQLFEFLTARELPGGKRRECPKVLIEAIKGGFKVTLTCYLLSMKWTAQVRYWSQIPDALLRGFTDPESVWVETQSGEGHKLRKEAERKRLESGQDELYNAVKVGGRRPLDAK